MHTSDLKGFQFILKHRRRALIKLSATLFAAPLLAALPARAQFRTIPAQAKRATVGQQRYPLPYLDLSGSAVRLAPGGVIYDQNNRTIVHNALLPGSEVAVMRDMNGDVGRVYVLTPQEQATFGKK
jgi:hypothetical protein